MPLVRDRGAYRVRVQFVLPQRVIVHDKACCVSVLCVLGIWRAGSACLVIDLLSYGVQMLRAWRFWLACWFSVPGH